jgi:hypothetical protein
MRVIEQLEWLSPTRLVVSAGFDPASAEYVIVDADTGRELGAHYVAGFNWTPAPGGAHFAYEYYGPANLCVDDECRPGGGGGYPKEERRLRFHWAPVWSEDGTRLAILVDEIGQPISRTVIVKRIGAPYREIRVPHEASDFWALAWEGPNLVLISEQSRWQLDAASSTFVPLGNKPPRPGV